MPLYPLGVVLEYLNRFCVHLTFKPVCVVDLGIVCLVKSSGRLFVMR